MKVETSGLENGTSLKMLPTLKRYRETHQVRYIKVYNKSIIPQLSVLFSFFKDVSPSPCQLFPGFSYNSYLTCLPTLTFMILQSIGATEIFFINKSSASQGLPLR